MENDETKQTKTKQIESGAPAQRRGFHLRFRVEDVAPEKLKGELDALREEAVKDQAPADVVERLDRAFAAVLELAASDFAKGGRATIEIGETRDQEQMSVHITHEDDERHVGRAVGPAQAKAPAPPAPATNAKTK